MRLRRTMLCDSAIIVIDGESTTLRNSSFDDDVVIPNVEVDLTYSENGYAATFTAGSEPEPNSIESTEQAVTLAVATPDGRSTYVDGVLFCGV